MEQTGQNVWIRLRSSQERIDGASPQEEGGSNSPEQEDAIDRMESVSAGKYYRKGDRQYIFYEELVEGVEEAIATRVTLMPERMEVQRNGAVNMLMVFVEGELTIEEYRTNYGDLTIGVNTKKLRICEKPDSLEVDAEYLVEINGRKITWNRMELCVDFER